MSSDVPGLGQGERGVLGKEPHLGHVILGWECSLSCWGCDRDHEHNDGKEAALCPGSDYMDVSSSVTLGQALPLPQFPHPFVQGDVLAHCLLPDAALGSGGAAVDEGWSRGALGELSVVSSECLCCPQALHPLEDSGSQQGEALQ